MSEKEDNIVAMRRFCDELESHSRSLGCLGVEPDTYGTMLAPVVMGKLPQSWSLLISRNVGDGWELKSSGTQEGSRTEGAHRVASDENRSCE